MLTDILLINKVKEENDQKSFLELVNRHTGIYNTIVYRYLHTGNKSDYYDLIGEREYNFYSFVKDYDETKNMKFSTFVGDRTKYLCLDRNSDSNEIIKEEIDDGMLVAGQPDFDLFNKDIMNKLRESIDGIKNKKFKKIMELRFFSSHEILTFREIAKKMNVTTQYVNKIYKDNIDLFIQNFKKNNLL